MRLRIMPFIGLISALITLTTPSWLAMWFSMLRAMWLSCGLLTAVFVFVEERGVVNIAPFSKTPSTCLRLRCCKCMRASTVSTSIVDVHRGIAQAIPIQTGAAFALAVCYMANAHPAYRISLTSLLTGSLVAAVSSGWLFGSSAFFTNKADVASMRGGAGRWLRRRLALAALLILHGAVLDYETFFERQAAPQLWWSVALFAAYIPAGWLLSRIEPSEPVTSNIEASLLSASTAEPEIADATVLLCDSLQPFRVISHYNLYTMMLKPFGQQLPKAQEVSIAAEYNAL